VTGWLSYTGLTNLLQGFQQPASRPHCGSNNEVGKCSLKVWALVLQTPRPSRAVLPSAPVKLRSLPPCTKPSKRAPRPRTLSRKPSYLDRQCKHCNRWGTRSWQRTCSTDCASKIPAPVTESRHNFKGSIVIWFPRTCKYSKNDRHSALRSDGNSLL